MVGEGLFIGTRVTLGAAASPEGSKPVLQADTEVQWVSAGVLGFLCPGVRL